MIGFELHNSNNIKLRDYVEVARDSYLPGNISQPRKEQAAYMSKRIKDPEDPEAPFRVPV